MREKIHQWIQDHAEEIIALGDDLFVHPELGFREFETGRILKEFMEKYQLKVEKEYAVTGFSVSIGEGEPHIGIIAELDAIPTPKHPCADPVSKAAHACGHSTQQVIALAALCALKENCKDLKGKITLFFTPAEEFTDLNYRKELRNEGKIRYLSGKENMLYEKLFDDVDCILHFHAMGSSDCRFSVNSVLSGFAYKKITFEGRAAHAAAAPDRGINALNECTLFLNAVALLRETFRDEDVVRVHGIIDEGGQTVNSIPDKVVYECYVRSVNPDVVLDLNRKLSNAAECCAKALGGSCIIEDTPGYLPLHQSKELNEVVYENMLHFTEAKNIKWNEISAAAGDVGDICMFKPIIQYGYGGFTGRIHGEDLFVADKEEVYLVQSELVADIVVDLLSHPEKVEKIKKNFTPKMTYEEYLNYLNQ